MPVLRQKGTERWIYNEVIRLANGARHRIKGRAPKHCNTKEAAAQAMRAHRARIEGTDPNAVEAAAPVITFDGWFHGRFWREWVVGHRNKPTEVDNKRYLYDRFLKEAFGALPLDEITTARIAAFRASLVEGGLEDKYINNILAVLSKPLRYALDVEILEKVPRIPFAKVDQPEIEPWDFDAYAAILAAAYVEAPMWYAAVCLAGEAGLRRGEILALKWPNVDLISKTVMVKEQTCNGVTTTPKGRTWRAVPITATLEAALRALPAGASERREGYVVCNPDGRAMTKGRCEKAILRICKRVGPSVKRWHKLRHTFATHAAMFGVNPFTLQTWLGHKSLTETQRYVHLAKNHRRPLPPEIVAAGAVESDPDARIVAMLGKRGSSGPRLRLVGDETRGMAAA